MSTVLTLRVVRSTALLALAFAVAARADGRAEAEQWRAQAQAYVDAKKLRELTDYEEFKRLAYRAIEADPTDDRNYVVLIDGIRSVWGLFIYGPPASDAVQARMWKDCVAANERALAQPRTHVTVSEHYYQSNIAACAHSDGNHARALAAADATLALDTPKDGIGAEWEIRADALAGLNRTSEALKAYEEPVRLIAEHSQISEWETYSSLQFALRRYNEYRTKLGLPKTSVYALMGVPAPAGISASSVATPPAQTTSKDIAAAKAAAALVRPDPAAAAPTRVASNDESRSAAAPSAGTEDMFDPRVVMRRYQNLRCSSDPVMRNSLLTQWNDENGSFNAALERARSSGDARAATCAAVAKHLRAVEALEARTQAFIDARSDCPAEGLRQAREDLDVIQRERREAESALCR